MPYIIIFVNSSAAVWLEDQPWNQTKMQKTKGKEGNKDLDGTSPTSLRRCPMHHVTTRKIVNVLKKRKRKENEMSLAAPSFPERKLSRRVIVTRPMPARHVLFCLLSRGERHSRARRAVAADITNRQRRL